MSRLYILDDAGDPIVEDDPVKWGLWLETANRHIGKTVLADGTIISTVFLGMDHSFLPECHLPVFWETMIFGGQLDCHQERYTSKEYALRGHEEAVSKAQSAVTEKSLKLGVRKIQSDARDEL